MICIGQFPLRRCGDRGPGFTLQSFFCGGRQKKGFPFQSLLHTLRGIMYCGIIKVESER